MINIPKEIPKEYRASYRDGFECGGLLGEARDAHQDFWSHRRRIGIHVCWSLGPDDTRETRVKSLDSELDKIPRPDEGTEERKYFDLGKGAGEEHYCARKKR